MLDVSNIVEKSSTALNGWVNRIWYIMLIHKITTVRRRRNGEDNAKIEFLETWTVFLYIWAKGD